MKVIKIRSNPYERKIEYYTCQDPEGQWEEIRDHNPNSRLREEESERNFLPFKIKEIVDIVLDEYYIGTEKVHITFEGAQEEYEELEKICELPEYTDKILLTRENVILENAKLILSDTKEIFKIVRPVIENIIRDDEEVQGGITKIADALDDIIPICVFGNFSVGKSTFINALIGHEILPSGGDPVTAKIYKISRADAEECARIRFKHWEDEIELLYEGKAFRIRKGDTKDEMLVELTQLMNDAARADMYAMIYKALEFINSYEKKDMDSIEISDIIEVEVPFVNNGVLGRSRNNFVIFDTPGSNSNSNTDHAKVLSEALQGFSNGIPVWVAQYENVDSNDNAKLCDDILKIKALDKRFTMIVLNKADTSDLPVGGFTDEKTNDMLNYNSVKKMYASGIFFVSSIMGLGAKNDGEFTDKYYRKIYRSQYDMFTDPEDLDYMTVYIYNIMPEQIKNEIVEYAKACTQTDTDLIYANSGLYCIEQEIEDFAGKYSAYNKCQMVYMFLNDVIGKATEAIQEKRDFLIRTREARKKDLAGESQQLLDKLLEIIQTKDDEFLRGAKAFLKTYVSSGLDYSYEPEELAELDEQIAKYNEEMNQFADQESDYMEAKKSLWSNLKTSGQSLLKGDMLENIINIKNNLIKDYKEMQESKDERDLSRSEIDRTTSDEIMRHVVNRYKRSILEAQEKASAVIKQHWADNAEILKNVLVAIITGTDALSTEQKAELSELLVRQQGPLVDDEANRVFVKAKYLKGQIFGFKLGTSERLNTRRLANRFNDLIGKNISSMAKDLNDNCYSAYTVWRNHLYSVVEENITELNPQLKQLAELIKEETDRINELEDNQRTITASLETIGELMDWKVLE